MSNPFDIHVTLNNTQYVYMIFNFGSRLEFNGEKERERQRVSVARKGIIRKERERKYSNNQQTKKILRCTHAPHTHTHEDESDCD